MAGKNKKKKEAGAKENGNEQKKPKKGGGKSKKGKSKNRCNVDIMTDAAMDNVYYACHNVQELLKVRGFAWPEAQKKKKKGKK